MLVNCKRCGKLMLQNPSSCCENCSLYYDETYREIRRFLSAHPQVNAYEVHRETGIPLSVVLELMRSS
ncbi:hypothetical protein [Gorillibacterium sp. sgz500922]|uniref:hypothetical protein n=1 Tax=Gorillibacterium sp. sgz500922 TaxID=3446694 RepID=UPI003F663B79